MENKLRCAKLHNWKTPKPKDDFLVCMNCGRRFQNQCHNPPLHQPHRRNRQSPRFPKRKECVRRAILTADDYRLCPICLLCENDNLSKMKSNGSMIIQQIATQCGLTVTSINRWKADGSLKTFGSPARAKTEDARKCAIQHGYYDAFPTPPKTKTAEDELPETIDGAVFISFEGLFELFDIPKSIQKPMLQDFLRQKDLPLDTPAKDVDFKLPRSIDELGGKSLRTIFHELALTYVGRLF